ncbi:sodium/hydrogen exchanger [Hymenobacter qilianensis]|uniref:Sodium/hydrogen exchanger n=2 Tax=Hymenobacter qilianensis TaxID=1385715 RepID=A0ACB5PLU3_9BACT|nr:cation:proton antiporter [Hymenobacter qilianensis]QNP50705.1 cation:proton antiporter [Hymenobacter qilianensis]GGF51459.1 sodium/hydrogen exchanger [Hymenobacter qilianensis]
MHVPIFSDVIIILLLSVGVILLVSKLRLPSIVGFLVTGIVAGPSALGLVKAQGDVDMLAELGVILLMFTIGLEFSLSSLSRLKRAVFLGGSLQVGLTIGATYLLAVAFGYSTPEAVFLGFLLALSSTAIVLKLLQDWLEMESLHGQVILAILIFQDLIVVPMMLLTPMLAGKGAGNPWADLGLLAFKISGVLALVWFGARYLMPRLLFVVAQTRSRELFLLTTIGTCLGVAWLTSTVGLSLALGAFLAGLIISESEYSYEAVSNILPFREIFASFFFVSIGMLLDVRFFLENPLTIVLITLAVMAVKLLLTVGAALALRLPMRSVLLIGLALCQVGEFAFILSKVGLEAGLMQQREYQYFLAVSILTMSLTPLVMLGAEPFATFLLRLRIFQSLDQGLRMQTDQLPPDQEQKLSDHLVVMGYGFNGRNLVKAAKYAKVPYVIIETNPITVRQEREKGEPILYGDASQEHVLEQAHVEHARVMVVAISDPASSRRIVVALRKMNPNSCIFVRTRYIHEMEELYRLGATEVIPEELEASIEIFSRVLAKYLVPMPEIDKLIGELRAGRYDMLRRRSLTDGEWSSMHISLADAEMSTFRVSSEGELVGKTLSETEVRQRFGISLLAIRRGGQMLYEMTGDTVIKPDDTLYIFGPPERVQEFARSAD